MSEANWDQARLIPTSGINGPDEQGRRVTSALLAVIGVVREFGRALVRPLGAPAGVIETFIDVSFGEDERKCFPDGLIRVRRGPLTWTALVEVRTGGIGVDAAQQELLLEVAQEQGFDAVLTISNQAPAPAERQLGRVGGYHRSWGDVLATAVAEQERGVDDPDQSWVLAELIRYLEHPRSGTRDFEELDSSQVVRRVRVVNPDPPGPSLPEQREPVREVDLRNSQVTVLHTVLIAESAVRTPPPWPSRRELRLVRRLGAGAGEQAAADQEAGWYQDPGDAGRLRWWDGVAWSERTYPEQPALA